MEKISRGAFMKNYIDYLENLSSNPDGRMYLYLLIEQVKNEKDISMLEYMKFNILNAEIKQDTKIELMSKISEHIKMLKGEK